MSIIVSDNNEEKVSENNFSEDLKIPMGIISDYLRSVGNEPRTNYNPLDYPSFPHKNVENEGEKIDLESIYSDFLNDKIDASYYEPKKRENESPQNSPSQKRKIDQN